MCRVVFLGDYLDPFFYMSKVRLLENLREIIDFKRSRPEDSVLLMGNHDLHYFCGEASPASRFDAGIAGEASSLFLDNLDLFQYAFQDGEYLFTHAGVSQLWFDYDFRGEASRSIAEQLNHPRGRSGGCAASCRVCPRWPCM